VRARKHRTLLILRVCPDLNCSCNVNHAYEHLVQGVHIDDGGYHCTYALGHSDCACFFGNIKQPCCENSIKVAIQSTVPMFSTRTHLCVVSLTVTGLTGICSPASGQMMVEGCDSQTQSYLGSSLPWDAGTGQLELQLVQDVPADTELCKCIGLSPSSATVCVYAQVFLRMFGVVCSYHMYGPFSTHPQVSPLTLRTRRRCKTRLLYFLPPVA